MVQVTKGNFPLDFTAISISIASPEDVMSWSYGEVVKPETINYRTQKPERGGLFCERIFGPTKNWQCSCGKYKRVRYEGVVCEKCGVEVTRSIVRRERMAHIKLAVPISHIWYLRSSPSCIGLLLDLPVKQIEQVIYFASYIITSVDDEAKKKAILDLEQSNKDISHALKQEYTDKTKKLTGKAMQAEKDALMEEFNTRLEEAQESFVKTKDQLKALKVSTVITEIEYRDLAMNFGHVFSASIGAEAIRELIDKIDLAEFAEAREDELKKTTGLKQKKIIKRLRLASGLLRSSVKPAWMVLTVLPVIPPDLRPMVQLDGGRFAASDLNDLYRRVINRNNRLKRLLEIGAPEVICRNEKRMLQEAVDALLNSDARIGKTTFNAAERRKLRSLSDMLKGKQGRFRQNLLGKRVDYSGRSVIVGGPNLKLDQCGLPKEMALKLFKPFVIALLMKEGYAYNLKMAEKVMQSQRKEVWDILERVTKDHYVLLNRAPTLHRLGIQAFKPVLIEGKAIQIHPLVCSAYNADFDGDMMGVHVPLSEKAQIESRLLMAANKNLLKPSSGDPITKPTQDMVLGCYYLTKIFGNDEPSATFANKEEAILSYDCDKIGLNEKVRVRIDGQTVETSVGRVLFNEIVPPSIGYINREMGNKPLSQLINEVFNNLGKEITCQLCDDLKDLGFKYATVSGITMSYFDLLVPIEKEEVIRETTDKIKQLGNYYWRGLVTDEERFNYTIKLWEEAKKTISKAMLGCYPENNHISLMVESNARGTWENITQISGMKGLVANPAGKTIELPIKSNFKEGLTIIEYFNGAPAGRKGKVDTALNTANSGYLTRRLVDSVQDILVKENDCGTKIGRIMTKDSSSLFDDKFVSALFGRVLIDDLVDEDTGELLVSRGQMVDWHMMQEIRDKKFTKAVIRSVMYCHVDNGVCQLCYGADLADNEMVKIGTAVGVIAAQSIGEPGTQLTMNTFHSGGIASEEDITQGLSRVEEIFEARTPKTPSTVTEIEGRITLNKKKDITEILVSAEEMGEEELEILTNFAPVVHVGDDVKQGQVVLKSQVDKTTVKSTVLGKIISIDSERVVIAHSEYVTKTYLVSPRVSLLVEDGSYVKAGEKLTIGHLDLRKNMKIRGVGSTQEYILRELQNVYTMQGVKINDKHFETIVKQMFSKVRIDDPADSLFLAGDVVNFLKYEAERERLKADGLRPMHGEILLLGLSKIASYTDSWLSAASFQETIRTLVRAAVIRKVDKLRGLKENVIIGRLIPTHKVA